MEGLSRCDPTKCGVCAPGCWWLLGAVTLHGILLHHPRARGSLERLGNDGSATFRKLGAASQGWSWEKQNPSASPPPSPLSSFPSWICFPFFIYSPLWGIIYTLNCRPAVNFLHFLQLVPGWICVVYGRFPSLPHPTPLSHFSRLSH